MHKSPSVQYQLYVDLTSEKHWNTRNQLHVLSITLPNVLQLLWTYLNCTLFIVEEKLAFSYMFEKKPVLCTLKSLSLSISSSLKNHQSLCSFLEMESTDLLLLKVYSNKKFAQFPAFTISLVFMGIKYLPTANSQIFHIWTKHTLDTSRFHLLFLIQDMAINYIFIPQLNTTPPLNCICVVKMSPMNCKEYRTIEN